MDFKFSEKGPGEPVTEVPASDPLTRIGLSPFSRFMLEGQIMLHPSFSVRRCQTVLCIHHKWRNFSQASLLQLHHKPSLLHPRVFRRLRQPQEDRSFAMPVPRKATVPKIVRTESLSKYLFWSCRLSDRKK
jgi:hypothetical protein